MKIYANNNLDASYMALVGLEGGVETILSSYTLTGEEEAMLQTFFNLRIELTNSTSFDCVGPVESNPDINRSTQNYHLVYRPDAEYGLPQYTDELFPMLGVLSDTSALYTTNLDGSVTLAEGNQLSSEMETLLDTLIAAVP